MRKPKPFERLYVIAETQQGYFTARQAAAAGFGLGSHHYHVKKGHWLREYRGIYRLAHYPQTDDAQLIVGHLWSMNRQGIAQGVYSHQTALSLRNLSDLMPAKLHMTVPPHFRRNGKPPDWLALHRGQLEKSDIEPMRGFSVVKPFQSILDLAREEMVSRDILEQAIREGVGQGLVPIHRLREALRDPAVAPWLKTLLQAQIK
ncbi:MAG: hypothetical protein PHV34_14845 [Verrucomicrobiae bacterium]|nr:hypothetical protein [Verrucomicrobiae bacterium]